MLRIVEDFLPADCQADTHKHMKPDSITIHWVGPYPGQSPADVRKYWLNTEASAHFIIKDGICMQCWPTDKVAWHCGSKKGNESSIGIEVIPANKEGEFSEASIKTLRELIAHLGINIIYRHFDWSGKDCPAYYTDNARWNSMLQMLRT